MTQFLLIVVAALGSAAAIAVLIAREQDKKAKKAMEETRTLRDAFRIVKEKAERLQDALDKTAKVKGEADAERKELAEALDSELIARANNLFS
jgi:flagellar basal body-associated protein FliL